MKQVKKWISTIGTRYLVPGYDAKRSTQDAVDDAVHELMGKLGRVPDDMHVSLSAATIGNQTIFIACAVGYVERPEREDEH